MLADDYEALAIRRLQDPYNSLVHNVGHRGAILGGFSFSQIDTCKGHNSLIGAELVRALVFLMRVEGDDSSPLPVGGSASSVGRYSAFRKCRMLSDACLILSRTLGLYEACRTRRIEEPT
jgi:hypothetical protein